VNANVDERDRVVYGYDELKLNVKMGNNSFLAMEEMVPPKSILTCIVLFASLDIQRNQASVVAFVSFLSSAHFNLPTPHCTAPIFFSPYILVLVKLRLSFFLVPTSLHSFHYFVHTNTVIQETCNHFTYHYFFDIIIIILILKNHYFSGLNGVSFFSFQMYKFKFAVRL
jgi:hypothetical protein